MDSRELKGTPDTSPRSDTMSRLVIGVSLIAAGVLFTLDNFGVIAIGNFWMFWPLILVAVGVTKLFARSFLTGVALVMVGGLFLARNFGALHFRLSYLLPLVFVFIGLRIVFANRPGARSWDVSANPGGTLNEWAVFGGGERRIISPNFQGGQANAVFGGFNLDLRDSKMAGDRAVIDVFCFCGGGELRVPEDWNVILKVVPIFGGTDDKSRHVFSEPARAQKDLLVTGFILFGGLGIKN
jgi:predicted membrane protein